MRKLAKAILSEAKAGTYGVEQNKQRGSLEVWGSRIAKDALVRSESTKRASEIILHYHKEIDSPIKKLKTIRIGLLSSAILHLMELTGSNQAHVAHLLSVTEPTLRKYIKNGKHLDATKSEHIIELFELFDKGLDTFGSFEEFKKWIESPNIIFQDPPVKMLDTITGINMVKNALLRLDYGVLA